MSTLSPSGRLYELEARAGHDSCLVSDPDNLINFVNITKKAYGKIFWEKE